MNAPRRKKGLYDSSATRVWPVFQGLIQKDPSGLSWLPQILSLPQGPYGLAAQLRDQVTPLVTHWLQKRKIGGNVLKNFGGGDIEMEACFEKTIPPSQGFLRWMIHNPDRLTWPRRGRQTYSQIAQEKRERLFGRHGEKAQAATQAEALAELDRLGADRGHGKWWSFEGITHVDCYLETENMILLIEGKRTETLSSRTDWYPDRNQLVRSLEVAQEISVSKNFAVLVIAENKIDPITAQVVERSLPHFTPEERADLMQHYLGCITWRDACQVTGISYESLPDTVVDWIGQKR